MTPDDLDKWFDVLLEQIGKAVIIGVFVHAYYTTGKADPTLMAAIGAMTAGVSLLSRANKVNDLTAINAVLQVSQEPTSTDSTDTKGS